MSFLDTVAARLPFGKKEEVLEYYFALNISAEKLIAALWAIGGKHLQILDTASSSYSSGEEITKVTDQLLDKVLGVREIEPQKILFGVPEAWLQDDNLKEEYSKLLRDLVKDLELQPLAYVATSHALIHFLEKTEGVPTTAILVGFAQHHLEVIVVRAGKLDGVKTISRGDNSGADIEKALLTFADVETLPSKILIYGLPTDGLEKLKTQLLSFPWMSKLSFLHFPKIEVLKDDIEIKSVCFAGASEIHGDILYTETVRPKTVTKQIPLKKEEAAATEEEVGERPNKADLGFVVGDVAERGEEVVEEGQQDAEESEEEKGMEGPEDSENSDTQTSSEGQNVRDSDVSDLSDSSGNLKSSEFSEKDQSDLEDRSLVAEAEDFEEMAVAPPSEKRTIIPAFLPIDKFFPRRFFKNTALLLGIIGFVLVLSGAYLFLPKAEVKVFVEPRILEKDTQVTADPTIKEVNEEDKKIPGQIVSTEISGTGKQEATGKKQIGDPAKGSVVLRNKTDEAKTISKGTILASSGFKFSLDNNVQIASRSAEDGTWGRASGTVTASTVGPDGNLPSGTDLKVGSFSDSQVIAKAEGNFSGGTSKEVTVVSDADQKKLLASLASELKVQAKQKLQEEFGDKKISEEALSEEIIKKSYSKNVNDQASEFSLNLIVRFKGTAFEDQHLKQIVSKLVSTDVPEGFELNLADTETQADVSKVEKDGKLIFLARFRAKLMPKLDIGKIKNQIKGKTPQQAVEDLKTLENVLGSEIKISPNLPKFLQRLPILERNIQVEVGLK
ncbi:baseplate J/gp47 family protein [Candidatus Microgenomates bacterium]|nr:baseplate J/gp47 family protein [Candidatus Microgenomates bacterium]